MSSPSDPPLHRLGVAEAAGLLRTGELAAEPLAEHLLTRAEAHAALNAFVALDADQIRKAARAADRRRESGARLGPLHGVPIALKDNIDTATLPTTAGTPALRGHRPRRDAEVARRLLEAGAILFGKVGLHELALGVTSNNAGFGAIRNPHDPDRGPGGSSGGSGVAVAAHLVPASIGTDTGGSIRIPAACCGVHGFRPSAGRWPGAGIAPISTTRDTPGPLARSIADLALIDAVITGETPVVSAAPLKGVRLAVPRRFFWEDLEAETERLCTDALKAIEAAGAELVEIDLSAVRDLDEACGFSIALYEWRRDFDRYLRDEGLALSLEEVAAAIASPDVKAIVQLSLDPATAVSEPVYREALNRHRADLVATYRRGFAQAGAQALLFPTVPLVPPRIGDDQQIALNGRLLSPFASIGRNMGPPSVAGLPGITIPVGQTTAGLPVGLAVDAPSGQDRRLLALALGLERAVGRSGSGLG